MNKLFITSALIASALFCTAQTVNDGLLYGQQDDLYGTARYRALSGAFGALGGDLTAMGQNPAGSVIFANHFASFSLANSNNTNNSIYFDGLATAESSDLDINQAGGVLVFKAVDGSPLSKFAVGFNYDATRSYDNNVFLAGNSTTSISQYFLNNANGFSLDNFETQPGETLSSLYQFLGENIGFDAQQGFLGFQSFIIDPVNPGDPNNTQYVSATGTGSFNQGYEVISSGSQNKISFNLAGQLYDKWSFGVNLNAHSLNYSRFTGFREVNSNTDATTTGIEFRNELNTTGNGISVQVGTIGKITESLRLGATYESPTWYTIEETLVQEISANRRNGAPVDVIPNIINVYAPYDLRTPGSLTGSIAYIFGTAGLLSLDYSTKDYSNLEFSPKNEPAFADNNAQIMQQLDRAATLRVGGEYRIDNFTLRGGFRTVESPYKNKEIQDDYTGYSLGLGYTWGSTNLDVSYDYADRNYSQQLFPTGLTTRGQVQNEKTNVAVTLGFNF
ncbi:OmpP1/FadL family transporter [Nonlabens marinus]|nr:hemin receptor [Nonlabens marinus]